MLSYHSGSQKFWNVITGLKSRCPRNVLFPESLGEVLFPTHSASAGSWHSWVCSHVTPIFKTSIFNLSLLHLPVPFSLVCVTNLSAALLSWDLWARESSVITLSQHFQLNSNCKKLFVYVRWHLHVPGTKPWYLWGTVIVITSKSTQRCSGPWGFWSSWYRS